jgi:NifU-like protein
MWDYTEKVLELFHNPKNQGLIEKTEETGVAVVFGEVGSIACGDALRLHLKIQIEQDSILDARFQTFGCTSAIASSSALTELVKGLTLDQALNVTNQDIANFLGGLPEAKMHCSVMGQEALEAAIFNYRGIPLANHEDDEGALTCSCYGVSDSRIRRIIIENGLTRAEQVTNYIKAGGGCGSCLVDIDDILDAVLAEQAKSIEAVTKIVHQKDTIKPLTNLQKITLIQQVIEEEIRPFLMADGGDVELHDVEGDRVLVNLKGACDSCASQNETLKGAIETRLRAKISPTLIVEAV